METKRLYQEGNGEGRIICADMRCAGATAHASGMTQDLNGARIVPMTQADVLGIESLGYVVECEMCHAPASVLA